MTAFLEIEQRRAASEESALDTILELASACGSPAWAILQSFPKPYFEKWYPQKPAFDPSFGEIFNGRIFGAGAEVRWLREGSDWWIWRIREAPAGSPDYRARDRRYYLWGSYKPDKKAFLEDRIPALGKYPVPASCEKDDRAYIEVREYVAQASLPVFPLDVKDLEDQLNQPRIAAHRFIRVGCGRDPHTREDD